MKPAFDDFILPTKKYADIIIPRGGDNHVAIDLIVQHIRTKLGQHDLCKIYPNLYVIQSAFQVIFKLECHLPYSLHICFIFKKMLQLVAIVLRAFIKFSSDIKQIPILLQIRGMHTLIRDAETTKHDFIFYADRLIRLVSMRVLLVLSSSWVDISDVKIFLI